MSRIPLLSKTTAIMVAFFFQAFASGGLYTRIPDIQRALDLSESQLGLTLMGQPVGALLVFLFASRIVESAGPRLILAVGLVLLASWNVAMGIAPSQWVATVLFALFGATFALANVAMNVEADRIEAETGERIMNRCHGLWSFGFLITSLIGAGARGWEWSVLFHFAVLWPLIIIAVVLVIFPMTPAPARVHTGTRSRRINLPTMATMMLVGFGLSAALIENGTRAWAVIFMRDTFSAPDWVDTMALPAFVAAMFLTRMIGDRIVAELGQLRAAYVLFGTSLVGAVCVIFALSLGMAIVGFVLLGIGIAVIFPMAMSAAAQIGDRPASENVASLTLGISLIMLIAPGIMGFVADSFGVRVSFGLFVPLLLTSLFLSRRVLSPR